MEAKLVEVEQLLKRATDRHPPPQFSRHPELLDDPNRIVRAPARTVSIRCLVKVRFEDRFDHQLGCGLHHPIPDGGYPDMNAPYGVDGCIEFARRVEPLDIYWLEEPLHWYLQPADFVRLAAVTSIPLAHGERELTRFTVRDFIATGAIRYVQFDSTRAAGFTEGLRVRRWPSSTRS